MHSNSFLSCTKIWVVAHENLVTAPEAKFSSPFLDLTGTGTWPLAWLVNSIEFIDQYFMYLWQYGIWAVDESYRVTWDKAIFRSGGSLQVTMSGHIG